MQRNLATTGALLGGILSVPVITLLYFGERVAALPFVPFDIFDWLARILPGNVITVGIDSIVGLVGLLGLGPTDSSAKLIEQIMALGLFVLGAIVFGALLGYALNRRPGRGLSIGVIGGTVAFLIVAAIELWFGVSRGAWLNLLWLAIIFGGWGITLGLALDGIYAPTVATVTSQERRVALGQLAGGSLLLALVSWGAARWLAPAPGNSGANQPLPNLTAAPTPPNATAVAQATAVPGATAAGATTPVPEATATLTMRERVAAAPGTRPEVTPNADFYRIDINTRPPQVDGATWTLAVAGLFDNAQPLTLNDLMALPAVTQPITLSCISNPIGGDLISASMWTGVRLRDLLNELGLRAEARELAIEATDGFYESVAMADLMDPRTLLVYGMNGETLPVEHGFPLRIYIPNRYGMKQPKWITRIEAIDHQGAGYWVDRGWSAEARPHIISIIDTVAVDAVTAEGAIPVGGIAWAGDRGIRQVEVQVDDGAWQSAILRTPPLGPLIWVQWRYDWPSQNGQHTFRVRATDGTGALQIGEPSSVRPDGATGYHEVTRTIDVTNPVS
ncbi:MAG: molybdopterin-dependent oxidoreductase [Caldilineaceae bacterium]